jgi:cell wall-associated NlpC family hydrolase
MAIPAAMKVQDETGIPWQAIVAVSANETGYGKAAPGNNYFGIKGANPKTGATTGPLNTREVINGQSVYQNDPFMAFDNYLDSARGFASFLRDNSRYKPALNYLQKNPNDWRGFLRMVHDAGYATDPNWSDQVISIGNGLEGKEAADPTKPSKNLGHDEDTGRVGMTDLLDMASDAVGTRYQFGGAGGRSQFGDKLAPTDCSGFVAWTYERATGIRLNAQTSSMIKQTSNIRPDQAKPGDLIFYNMGEGSHLEHVGIYSGNGMMIHDSSINPNGGVDITPIWQNQNPQFRRVDGVDPTLYSNAQGGGLKPKASDAASEWVVKVEHGREIVHTYTPDGRALREDIGKASKPDGSILGYSGSNAQATVPEVSQDAGAGQDEQDDEDQTDYSFLDTPLSPDGETAFQKWKSQYAPQDSGFDYDLRGAFSAGLKPDPQSGHWPDTYKKPNHPTFSDQSRYAKDYPDRAGHWHGDQYFPASFLNSSTGNYEPLKRTRAGAGADEGGVEDPGLDPSQYFLNPATGNYEPIQKPLVAADNQTVLSTPDTVPSAATPPSFVMDPNRRPISQTAPNRLKPGELLERQASTIPEGAKPGEALDRVIGPSAGSLGQAASDMAGGVADAAGGALGAVGGALSGVFGPAASAIGQKASDVGSAVAQVPEALKDVNERPGIDTLSDAASAVTSAAPAAASAVSDTAGDAASALGTAVSSIPTPENRSAQDTLDQAPTQPPASEVVGPALSAAQQNLADEYTKILQNPGQFAHDLTQDPNVQAGMNGAGPLLAMTPGIASSIGWVAQNGFDVDHVNQTMDGIAHPDPNTRPASAKVAAGEQLNPVEGAQLITEMMDAHTDLRRSIAEAVQSPEIRDTPEGRAAAEGAAMVTDPQNLAMLADPELAIGKAGRIILDGTEPVATRLTGDAAEAAVKGLAKHAPEYTDFVRPLTQDEYETVLQRAALDLNDQALDDAVKINRGVDRYEPITGDQARREVMNAVARTNPGVDAQTVLDKTDDIMRGAGLDTLHSENAGAYGASLGERIGALREIGLAPEARAADRASLALGSRQAASVNAKLGVALGGGAAGGLVGMATEDPNDPNYYGKIATKMLVGLGSTTGVMLGSAYIPRGVSAALKAPGISRVVRAGRDVFAPAMNLTDKAQQWIRVWSGQTALGHEVGRDFADRVRRTWGKYADLNTLSTIEQTGRLPIAMLTDKNIDYAAARDTLDEWIQITKDFRDYGIIPEEKALTGTGKAQVYVPHVVDSSWDEGIQLGKRSNQPGRVPINPFWSYTQKRTHQTLQDGIAAGVTYLNKDIAGVLGRYYSAGIRARATSGMVDALETQAGINNASVIGSTLAKIALKGEDVVRVPPGMKVPGNSTWLGDIPGIGNKYKFESPDDMRTYVSNEFAGVMKNLFTPESLSSQAGMGGDAVRGFMSFNSALKHNTLSGSLFHLANEFRQFSATQGFSGIKNIPAIVKATVMPGEFRDFLSDPATRGMAYQAIKDGMTLNTLAEHDVDGVKGRIITSLLNTAGGAFVGSQAAAQAGLDPGDQAKWGLAGGAMGLATTVPGGGALIGSKLRGAETKSLVEAVSEGLWNRTIPMMKLTTYEMYAPKFGGQAAAEFANTVFGGQNLTAIARSKTVQDVMRIGMLAPDWTESWARLVGTSVLNTPTGEMSRTYWTNAAVQSAVLLEGMNHAASGHWSWENDPDHVLEVDMSNFYDRAGWKTVDDQGHKFTPYLDVLGPFKGLLQPAIDMGRALATNSAKMAGIDPQTLPGGPAVAGYFPKPGEPISKAIPAPDPAQKLANFIQARGGAVGTSIAQFADDRDFTGRPLDRNDDPAYQIVLNRINAAVPHLLPTGVSQVIRSGVHGEPWQITAGSAISGARVSHGAESERFFDMQDEFIKNAGQSQKNWQAILENNRNANQGKDMEIEGLISEQAHPDLTYADRGKQISDLFGKKIPESKLRQEQVPAKLELTDPTQDARLRSEIQWLDDQNTSKGTDTPADVDPKTVGLNQAEVMRMAWNRDPQLIEKLQGGGRRGLASQVGLDAMGELAKQRAVWTADVADEYGLDLATLQDTIKANLYGEKGGVPPPIPGVTSGQLDDIINEYQKKGLDDKGQPLDTAQQDRSQYLSDTVKAINAANPNGPQLDQANLARRINLRKLPMADQTPEQTGYDRAEEVRQKINQYNYVNPDGTPLGDAKQWAAWDQELKAADNKQERFNGIYTKRDQYGDYVPDEHLNQISDARTQAVAQRTKTVLRDPSLTPAQRDAYFKWFGEGSTLKPDEWKQFKDGTLDMWSDASKYGGTLPKAEWDRRVQATRLYSSLTKQERLDYDDQNVPNPRPLITWQGQTDPDGPATSYEGTLNEYMSYLNLVRNKKYGAIKVDPGEPDAVPSGG